MNKRRLAVLLFALAGTVVGAVLGVFATPHSNRYEAWVNVVLVPPPDMSSAEASSFWEVLTNGQISRTAAIIYYDDRWLPSAASSANTPQSELTLAAYAQPETTLLTVVVEANSSAAAESALNDVLTTATPEVSSVLAPYFVKVLRPPRGGPVPSPDKAQFAAAGALGGLLAGGGVGWLYVRWRRSQVDLEDESDEAVHPSDSVGAHARHRS
ncbi:MAG: hypothetical protein K0U76_00500 [Actinomycetia bacterium]|nr:hypothetical protein [Actinomycetes bacterium]MCH9699863.1 hypothetical protein [Actinomycetes bacterium]MCH9760497.1 hypothetical protein [Actinomycetes bacterium]